MAESCRPVTLPSGETAMVLGGREMTPQEAGHLGAIVEAVRRRIPPPEPGAEEMYERVAEVCGRRRILVREAAREIGVPFHVLGRLAQGRMPGTEAQAAIETWLITLEAVDVRPE